MGFGGYPIVLTADRTLMARYDVLLDGMLSATQTTATPSFLMKALLARRVQTSGLVASAAPLGLRRIESSLVRSGLSPEDVAVVAPESLRHAVGPRTRVVAVSTGDPLGIGMNSTTMSAIAGGKPWPAAWFQGMVRRLVKQRKGGASWRLVVGGPGAWQLAQNGQSLRDFKIDQVISGYAENAAPELIDRLMSGREVETVTHVSSPPANEIPPLRGASVMGVVELSRGCGLGCRFCALRNVPMQHLPIETVVADVKRNVTHGANNVAAISEDFFRYGAARAQWANPPALKRLLKELRGIPELRLIQIDHANLCSVAAVDDSDLREIRGLLAGPDRETPIWVNLGVETTSGELLCLNGGVAKMGPVSPADWGEFALQQILRLIEAGFLPLVSLVMGMPGEEAVHAQRDLAWVRRLRGRRVTVFPLLYAPLKKYDRPFGVHDMSADHWKLVRESYRQNFRWMPGLVWRTQAAAGVPALRRTVLQGLGRFQVLWWKALFVYRSGRLFG